MLVTFLSVYLSLKMSQGHHYFHYRPSLIFMYLIDKDIDILMSSSSTSHLQCYKTRSKVQGLLCVSKAQLNQNITGVQMFKCWVFMFIVYIKTAYREIIFSICFYRVFIPASILEFFFFFCSVCQWRSKNNAASFSGINMSIHQKPWQPLDSKTILGPLKTAQRQR